MSDLESLLAQQASTAPAADPLEALLTAQSNPAPVANIGNEGRHGPMAEMPEPLLDQLKHQISLTGRAGVTALTALPNMAGDAANGLLNLGIGGFNSLTGSNVGRLQYPSQITQQALTNAGVDEPRNGTERVVQAATSAMGSTAPSVAMGKYLSTFGGPTAKVVGNSLQTAPGIQTLSAGASGASGQGAAEAGFGPVGQILASIAGGGTTALAAAGGRGYINPAPSKEQLLAAALRDQAENQKPMPRYSTDALGNVQTTLDKPRYRLTPEGPVLVDAPGAPQMPTNSIPVDRPLPPVAPAPEGTVKPVQDQLGNIALLKKIGLNEQRPSTISGDRFTSGQDYENAQLNNPLGEAMRTQLTKEQTALRDFGAKIQSETGAKAMTPEQSGQTVKAPLRGLSDWFDGKITAVYNAAREKAGGMGAVSPDDLNNLLKDNNFRETLLSSKDGSALLGSIERQVKRFQGIPIEGEELAPAPNTVNSAENLRKWLNSSWSPTNSKQIGMVKQALDSDVARAGGAGVFDQARKLHQLRMNTLDNPDGIAKLLNDQGPNGVNQAIPDALVTQKLLAMPTSQFEHIVKTLTNLPPELKDMGNQAIAEIKGALAKRINDAGYRPGGNQNESLWNAGNVNREINANKSKMALVLTPSELENFRTLHDAGYVLQTPTKYKGAVAQGYNYLQSGSLVGIPAGASALGGWLGASFGGPSGAAMGATAGGALGGSASVVLKKGIDNSMAARLAAQLRNPLPQFPKQ
jgi:hypothetical protein